MLTKVEIRPVTGSPVELNTSDGANNPLFPLSDFSIVTNIDTHDAKKMAAAGQWKTFHYPDAMVVVAEGHIVGTGASDAARAASYFSQRLALLDAALPPTTVMTSRVHGTLRVRFDGMSEDADAEVVLTSVSAPLAAMFPANSEFQLTWKAFEPYFIGVGSSTRYQLG